jgi:hypothetical protein
VDLALVVHLDDQALRQRVHARDPYPVQAPRDLVGVPVELPAGVQLGHDDRHRGDPQLLMDVDRDAAPVVQAGDRAVVVQRNQDLAAVADQGLVHRVVDDLVDQLVEPAQTRVADVHRRPFPHVLESFEHLDLLGPVTALLRVGFGHGLCCLTPCTSTT